MKQMTSLILASALVLAAMPVAAQFMPGTMRPAPKANVTTVTTTNQPTLMPTAGLPMPVAQPLAPAPVAVQTQTITTQAPAAMVTQPVAATAVPVAVPAVAAAPVVTQTIVQQTPASVPLQFTQSPAYKECTALATTNPVAAEQKAIEWLKIDDGIGPHHCRAMALYGQRRFAEAADELATVRSKIALENVAMRSYVARQASKAWLDAGRPDASIATLGDQINSMALIRGRNAEVSQLTADLLHERARLRITYGQLNEALQDLDHAVSLTPTDESVLLERAQAFAQLNDIPLARQDVTSVLKLDPTNSKARELQRQLNAPGVK